MKLADKALLAEVVRHKETFYPSAWVRYERKSAKDYPPGTVLIINCVPNSLILDPEWNDAIERVKQAQAHLAFREVFLIEPVMSYSATLYGNPKRKRRRSLTK